MIVVYMNISTEIYLVGGNYKRSIHVAFNLASKGKQKEK